MKLKSKQILLAMLCCMVASAITSTIASAGTFNVYPMRLELEADAKIGSVTVVNDNDTAANMQVRAMTWAQGENGKDSMHASDELTFFPKIFTIPPQGQKVVRVGYQGKVLAKEIAFRLFIRELPVEKAGKMGMKMAVQISMPVFIRPLGANKIPLPEVRGISILDGKLVGWLENTGNRHLMAKKLDVKGSKAGKETYSGKAQGWYVLAGVKKAFKLGLSRKDCLNMDSIQLSVPTADSKSEASFPVQSALCDGIREKVEVSTDTH